MRTQNPLNFLGRVRVVPKVPDRIAGLNELARNLWWTWNPLARALFRSIDLPTWISCNGNPLDFLRRVRQAALDTAASDKKTLALYDRVMAMFREYRETDKTWFLENHKKGAKGFLVGYFCAEFGIHHTLPQYSGGLGVLAGDHIKSASDLGIPFIGVGLFYREGYFFQDIDNDGNQKAIYHQLDYDALPVTPARDAQGQPIRVTVQLPGREVQLKAWEVRVGRASLYLMDADLPENAPEDRRLTARLYGGDSEVRIQQEVILGIGGVRLLRALGKKPSVFHMNEGHSAFLGLERIREYQKEGLNIAEAIEIVRATTLFTTHTPVPAGNDVFGFDLVDRYFARFYSQLGMSRTDFLELGYDKSAEGREFFSMTALGLRLSSMANGVSEIHGQVSRNMWAHLFRDVPPSETPVDHITNGIHSLSWMSFEMQELMDKYLPKDWRSRVMEPELWNGLDKIPDAELFGVMNNLKTSLVDFIHDVLRRQHERYGETPDKLREIGDVFTNGALTIGFGRRFATYKRATLIFHDRERLRRILNNEQFPVQIVFAGKAHPADQQGQEYIRRIQNISREPGFKNKVVFIENYDINVCRRMTSGVDIWLNNPRKPLEASGTSGMKVPLNGGLNCSIPDGWWAEAYAANPDCGWAIGDGHVHETQELQDEFDAESLYRTLEEEIIPLYYRRDENGIPREWMKRVRASMKLITPLYSTNRMVAEYVDKFYAPGSRRHDEFKASDFAVARDLAEWKITMRMNWPLVRAKAAVANGGSDVKVGDKIEIVAEVELGRIDPKDVSVEIFVEDINARGLQPRVYTIPMQRTEPAERGRPALYKGTLSEKDSGEFAYTVRVVPRHKHLANSCELGLVRWA